MLTNLGHIIQAVEFNINIAIIGFYGRTKSFDRMCYFLIVLNLTFLDTP